MKCVLLIQLMNVFITNDTEYRVNLYLYKYENVCLSVCLFVTFFLAISKPIGIHFGTSLLFPFLNNNIYISLRLLCQFEERLWKNQRLNLIIFAKKLRRNKETNLQEFFLPTIGQVLIMPVCLKSGIIAKSL